MKQKQLLLIGMMMCVILHLQCQTRKRGATSPIKESKITEVSSDFIFGDNRPFPQCHASTVVRAGDGKYIVAWFGGTHEKHDDVGIWISKGLAGKWSAPVEIAKLREDPHWNPVLFKTPCGDIILYFKIGRSIDEWESWYMVSSDNGATWAQVKELVPGDHGGRGPVRNKPIILADGTWLAPASNEKKGVWNAFVDRSEDQGKTWKATEYLLIDRNTISGEGVIQPTLWESSLGKVHMLLRSSAGVVCRSDSEDNGKTWSAVYKTTLPNPNSGIDLTKLDNGTLALIYNRDGKNWGVRRPLAVAISKDNGKTWPVSLDIATGKEGDEFSYPAIIGRQDTLIATYTWKRQRIAFWIGKVE